MGATYTVIVPKIEGHTGVLPVEISGTDKEGKAVHEKALIPYGEEVTGVSEVIAKFLKENHGASIRAEKATKAEKKSASPPDAGSGGEPPAE